MVLAEDLRQAVLQAALQGKLTEQLETDSDVDEMLINIQAEKKKLIAEKKIKKEKPLPEIREEDIPFDIPDNWRWVRLGDILRVSSGDGLTSKNMIEGTIPVYGGNGINGYHDKSNVNRITLTIGRVGANCGAVHITKEKAWVTDNAFIVSFYMKQVNICYWAIVLKTLDLGNKSKATAQPVISGKTIYPVFAPLPPIEEQKRIVDKINEIMPKIDEYEKIEKELELLKKKFPTNMKNALLQAAMQGKLTEQLESDSSVDELLASIKKEKEELIAQKKIKKEKLLPDIEEEEIPFDIPTNWRWARLKNICTKIVDGDHNPPCGTLEKTEYLMLSAQNINLDKLVDMDQARYLTKESFEQENLRTQVQSGDIFFTIVGTLGRSCVYTGGYNISFQRSVAVISTRIYNYYLKCVLDSPYIQQYIVTKATGTAQKGFYLNQVDGLLIPIPPFEEQRRIVERLDSLLPLCEDLKE